MSKYVLDMKKVKGYMIIKKRKLQHSERCTRLRNDGFRPLSRSGWENSARSKNQSDCKICWIPPAHDLRKRKIIWLFLNNMQMTISVTLQYCSWQIKARRISTLWSRKLTEECVREVRTLQNRVESDNKSQYPIEISQILLNTIINTSGSPFN